MYGISPRSEAASGTGISEEKPCAAANLRRFNAVRSAAAGKTRGKGEDSAVFASIAREKDRTKEKTEA
ncbi:MAG: hypothetical protein KH054_00920 [Firmicutes bacterium]|nr:hypothetical protein [Bacillota bacterium]